MKDIQAEKLNLEITSLLDNDDLGILTEKSESQSHKVGILNTSFAFI